MARIESTKVEINDLSHPLIRGGTSNTETLPNVEEPPSSAYTEKKAEEIPSDYPQRVNPPAVFKPEKKSDNIAPVLALGLGLLGGLAYLASAPVSVSLTLLAGGVLTLTGCSDSSSSSPPPEPLVDAGPTGDVPFKEPPLVCENRNFNQVALTEPLLVSPRVGVEGKYAFGNVGGDHIGEFGNLVWTGEEYGTAYIGKDDDDDWGVYFQRIRGDGAELLYSEKIDDERSHDLFSAPEVVWNAKHRQFAVIWRGHEIDSRNEIEEIRYARIDEYGSRGQITLPVSYHRGNFSNPRILWNTLRDEYALSYSERKEGKTFARLVTSNGEDPLTGEGNFSLGAGVVDVFWTGEEYMGVGSMMRGDKAVKRLTRLDPEVGRVGDVVNLTARFGASIHSYVALSENEFGMAFFEKHEPEEGDDRPSKIYDLNFTRFSLEGAQMGENVFLGTAADIVSKGGYPTFNHVSASIIWTGCEYALAWADEQEGVQTIEFALINKEGQLLGEVKTLIRNERENREDIGSVMPQLVSAGDELGIGWLQIPFHQYYFARILQN